MPVSSSLIPLSYSRQPDSGILPRHRETLMRIDQLFQQAIAFVGAGDVRALERLLTDHPELEHLATPGPWSGTRSAASSMGSSRTRTCCGSWQKTSPSSAG